MAVGILGKNADEFVTPIALHATGNYAPLVGKRGEGLNLTSDLLRLPPVIVVQECQQLTGGRLDAPVSGESPVLMDGGLQQAHSTIGFGKRIHDVSYDRSKPPVVAIVIHHDKLKVFISLAQNALDSAPQRVLPAIRGHDHAHKWHDVSVHSHRQPWYATTCCTSVSPASSAAAWRPRARQRPSPARHGRPDRAYAAPRKSTPGFSGRPC